MKKILVFLSILLLTASCATIFNKPWMETTIYTTEPSVIVINNTSFKTIDNKAQVFVERRKEPLEFLVKTDSLVKKVIVESKNSSAYYHNLWFLYGIGMLVDKNNPKRYAFPHRIYVNPSDAFSDYSIYGPANYKGEWLFHLSLPHINSFRLRPENEGIKVNTGFWGLAVGLDYYYSKNQYLNLSASGVSDFFVPVPAAVDISGEYELMSSVYLSLSNNHKMKRFSVGYGLSYGQNTWDFRYYDRFGPPPPTREPVKKSSKAVGLIFNTYYQMGQNFNLGAIYRPSFYRPDSDQLFMYEHLFSIDLAWKIRLGSF